MRWINLAEAIDHAGDWERLRSALLDGSVIARMRHESGRTFPLEPRVWHTVVEIDLARSLLTYQHAVTAGPCLNHTVVVEIDGQALLEQFGAPGRALARRERKQGGPGRPSKREAVRAWISERTPAGQEPSGKLKQQASDKFRVTVRTIRNHLEN